MNWFDWMLIEILPSMKNQTELRMYSYQSYFGIGSSALLANITQVNQPIWLGKVNGNIFIFD